MCNVVAANDLGLFCLLNFFPIVSCVSGKKNLLICNSIPKYVQAKDTEVAAFPGHTVPRVVDYIRFGGLSVQGYGKILIHMGACDLGKLLDTGKIRTTSVKDFLRRFIRRRNSRALVIISSILPREDRYDEFLPYTHGINFALEKWCARSKGATVFAPTHRQFLKNGRPRAELFAKDGLHLDGGGVDRLEASLQQALSTSYLNKRLGSKRTHKLAALDY